MSAAPPTAEALDGVRQYGEAALRVLRTILATQAGAIATAADWIAESLMEGGVLHVFGSGHSHLTAEEAFHRAGGLVPVNPLLAPFLSPVSPPRVAAALERLPGVADALLASHDLRRGEVLIVISNSGINAAPVEVALKARDRGLRVVALTSLAHSRGASSRHPSGKKLYEVGDLTIDLCGAIGDAGVTFPGWAGRAGPTSGLAGGLIVHALGTAVVARFLAKGLDPPVYLSANVPGGDEHNRALEARYRDRIRTL